MFRVMNFYKVTCPGCSTTFIANRSSREYCGPRCAMRVRRWLSKGIQVRFPSKSEPVEASPSDVVTYAQYDQKRKAGEL